MSACPANQPVPRRFASRVGMPELSRASYRQCCACICSTRDKLNATIASRWCRCNRLNCSQVAQRVAVEGTFAGKLCPLAKDGQRHYLATGQRRGWTWGVFLIQAFGLAKIIACSVVRKVSQSTIRELLFLVNGTNKLTVGYEVPFFQVLSISHQTFKLTPMGTLLGGLVTDRDH